VIKPPTFRLIKRAITDSLPFQDGPEVMVRDNDPEFGGEFNKQMKYLFGTMVVKITPKAPKMNSYCERVIGSIQREGTDHFLFFSERQLQKRLGRQKIYHNYDRPHQGIARKIPNISTDLEKLKTKRILLVQAVEMKGVSI